MRPTSTSASSRRLAVVLAAAVLLALPTTALAAAEDPPSLTSQDATGCADHLVTLRPDGFDGDDLAVSITAQTLEARRPGWAHASWQAAPGTRLTDVIATAPDGSASRLPVTEAGEASDVVALTFCGSASAVPDPEPVDVEPPPAGPDDVATTAVPVDRGAGAGEAAGARTPPSEPDGQRTPTEPAAVASVIGSTPTGAGPGGPSVLDQAEAAAAVADAGVTAATTVAATSEGSWRHRLPDRDRRARPATVLDPAAPASPEARPAEARPARREPTGAMPIRGEAPTPAGGSGDPASVAWLLGALAGAAAWLQIRQRRQAPRPTATWG
jgi:hypothetical protein